MYMSENTLIITIIRNNQELRIKFKRTNNKYNQMDKQRSIFFLRRKVDPSFFTKMANFVVNGKEISTVIIGPCGNGKTTLMNILCGTNFSATQQMSSSTREIQSSICKKEYDKTFQIFDTPGSTSTENKYMHAAYIRQALTVKPLNAVFIMVRFETRYADIYKHMAVQAKMLEGYTDKIVYIITHLDQADNPEMFVKEFDTYLASKSISNQVVYLSNKYFDANQICNNLYTISSNMTQGQIKIPLDKFYKNFNIKLLQDELILLEGQSKQYIDKMHSISEEYIQFIKKLPQSEERETIIQDLAIQMKLELKTQVNEFHKHMQRLSDGQYLFEYFYTLQAEVQRLDRAFQNTVKDCKKGKQIYHNATGSHTDIRDLIKKCPNPECGLTWMRVQRCPNTVCGARPSCFFDIFQSCSFRYKTKRNLFGKLTLEKQPFGSTKKNISNQNEGKAVGCGQAMNFELLPRLDNIQAILIEWYKVTTMEEVIAQFQGDQQVQKTRVQIEKMARKNAFQASRVSNRSYGSYSYQPYQPFQSYQYFKPNRY